MNMTLHKSFEDINLCIIVTVFQNLFHPWLIHISIYRYVLFVIKNDITTDRTNAKEVVKLWISI